MSCTKQLFAWVFTLFLGIIFSYFLNQFNAVCWRSLKWIEFWLFMNAFIFSNTWVHIQNCCLSTFFHRHNENYLECRPVVVLYRMKKKNWKNPFTTKDDERDEHDQITIARLWFVRDIKENTSQFSINKFLANFPRQFRRIILHICETFIPLQKMKFAELSVCQSTMYTKHKHNTHTPPNRIQFDLTKQIVFVERY